MKMSNSRHEENFKKAERGFRHASCWFVLVVVRWWW